MEQIHLHLLLFCFSCGGKKIFFCLLRTEFYPTVSNFLLPEVEIGLNSSN